MTASPILPFPSPSATKWIEDYQQDRLAQSHPGTVRVYLQILRHFLEWIRTHSKKATTFEPELITASLVEQYLADLKKQGYSANHCKRVKSVISRFCQWLIEDKGILRQNPIRTVILERAPSIVPHPLTPAQRFIFHALVKQEDTRGKAIFALGYWTGLRVIDIVELQLPNVHVGPKSGWLHLDGEDRKVRDLDLPNEARRPLYDYLQHRGQEEVGPSVFLSQRGPRLSDAGVYTWFRVLKKRASLDDWKLIADVSFHDLRDDFVHRALEANWSLEEIAYYLGLVTINGLPSVQTPLRYTQTTRAQVKEKLHLLKG